MPPKSANKKKKEANITIWHHCKTCQMDFLTKERVLHEKHCPIGDKEIRKTMEFIRKGTFQTCTYKKQDFVVECLQHMPPKFLNNFVYLSDPVFKFLNVRVGQHVVIASVTNSAAEVLIRTVWPIPEKFLTTVYVPPTDFEIGWRKFFGGAIKIEPLTSHIYRPAKTVELELINWNDFSDLDENKLSQMEMMIREEMQDLIYTNDNTLEINFFNRHLELKVKSSDIYIEDEDSVVNIPQMVEKAMQKMSLKDKRVCFLVTKTTVIRIKKPESESGTIYDEMLTETDERFLVRLEDIGGLDKQIEIILDSLLMATGHHPRPKELKFSKGLLLHGPSGCGKSMVCDALVNFYIEKSGKNNYHILTINPSDIFSKYLGETEKNLRAFFEKAYSNYPLPTFIVIEDIQHLCPKNETKDLHRRINASICSLMDELRNRKEGQKTFILATTSDISNLHPGIRRNGRFDCEVAIPIPSPKDREEILKRMLNKIDHELTDQEITDLSLCTHGFVGVDLVNLVCNASLAAIKYSDKQIPILTPMTIHTALQLVKPSAMKEVLIQNPSVHWFDIGGQEDLKLKLKQSVEWPIHFPEKFQMLGIQPPKGILLYGPPGCSKTLFAKALATESNLNFISIKGPEIFSMWVGESERAIRDIFQKARQVSPAIIFFDEIDAIGSERCDGAASGGGGGGSSVKERVLTQLLTELDGVQPLQNVVIIAATNRPDMIDKALLRPGRIDRLIYVGLPDAQCRYEIFKIKLKNVPITDDVKIDELVKLSDGFTGAEIEALCHEAALKALEESFEASSVSWDKFQYAFSVIQPRTSKDLLDLYEQYRTNS